MKMNQILNKLLFIIIFAMVSICVPNFVYAGNDAVTIVLDPGHGGKDPGSSSGSLVEKDMTMKIATYMKEYLSEYSNVNVLMTHTGSTMSIEDRADFARNNCADLFVSIHINSLSDTKSQGAEAYVTYRTDLPKYHQEMSALANQILSNIAALRNEK